MTQLDLFISATREALQLTIDANGSQLDQIKALNAEFRASPNHFPSFNWVVWDSAVKEAIGRLHDNSHPLSLRKSLDATETLQILSQLFQIARNLCAGGPTHQESVRWVSISVSWI